MGRLKAFISVVALLIFMGAAQPASATTDNIAKPVRPPLTGSISNAGHEATWIITGANTCPDTMVALYPDCSGVVQPGTLVTLELTMTATASTHAWMEHSAQIHCNDSADVGCGTLAYKREDYHAVDAGTTKRVTWTLDQRAGQYDPASGATIWVTFKSNLSGGNTTSYVNEGFEVNIGLYNPVSNPNPDPDPAGDMPGTPQNLKVKKAGSKKAKVSWLAPADGGAVVEYVVAARSHAPGRPWGKWQTWSLPATQTGGYLTFKRKRATVQVYVWAENEAGSGAATATVTRRL